MHEAVIFISTEKEDIDIRTSFMSPEDIGMVGIADYIGDKISIPEAIAGVKVNSDGSFVMTRQDIESFFKRRFDELKKAVSDVTLKDFCTSDLYQVKQTIEKTYDTYVVLITDPTNDNYCAETLDAFLRETYYWFDECEEQTFYVAAAIDYHC